MGVKANRYRRPPDTTRRAIPPPFTTAGVHRAKPAEIAYWRAQVAKFDPWARSPAAASLALAAAPYRNADETAALARAVIMRRAEREEWHAVNPSVARKWGDK